MSDKVLYKQKRVFNFLRQRINGNLLNVFRQVILFPNLKKKIHPCIRVLTFSCCMHPISVICSFSNNQLMVQHFLKAKQMGEGKKHFDVNILQISCVKQIKH